VDGILERLIEEMGKHTKVIATGGFGSMIGTGSTYIEKVDDLLTLEGLRIIWERNFAAKTPGQPAAKGSAKTRDEGVANAPKPRSIR
jgi:type III pantothenate kinase